MQGAFWSLLFGLIFFVPFFGMAVGAAMGTLSSKMGNYGIDDGFINQTREKVTEGTSALFLMTRGSAHEKIIEELKGFEFELIASNLTKEQEARRARALLRSEQTAGSRPGCKEGHPSPTRLSFPNPFEA